MHNNTIDAEILQNPWLLIQNIKENIPNLASEQIDEVVSYVEKILNYYYIDPLTKLKNKISFEDHLKSIENSAEKISFIRVKLIFLKTINQTSHEAWNQHVLEVKNALSKLNNTLDLYRISWTKFIITLDESNIPSVLNQIENLKINMTMSDETTSIQSIPTNLAVIRNEKSSILAKMEYTLLPWASVNYYKPKIKEDINEADKMNYYIKLKEALEDWRVFPFFQPIADSKTLKINKYEALFRVKDRDWNYDMMNYYKYLIVWDKFRVDWLAYEMIKKVFTQASVNKNDYFSINLWGNDFLNWYLMKFITDEVKNHDIDTSKITFEILESAWEEKNISNNIDYIRVIKSFWFSISMDDFWVGNWSLHILTRLMEEKLLDFVKVDWSLVKKILYNNRAKRNVAHIVSIAHASGVKVIAEFISDKELVIACRMLNIDFLQWFHIWKPQENIPLWSESNTKKTINEINIPKLKSISPSNKARDILYSMQDYTFIESFRELSKIYLKNINEILKTVKNRQEWDFDELMIFPIKSSHDEHQKTDDIVVGSPLFQNTHRNDIEWYDYEEDYNRALISIKDKYNKSTLKFNKAYLLQNALNTEIDIQIPLDIGYSIFLNKKAWDVSREEFAAIIPTIDDMVFYI